MSVAEETDVQPLDAVSHRSSSGSGPRSHSADTAGWDAGGAGAAWSQQGPSRAPHPMRPGVFNPPAVERFRPADSPPAAASPGGKGRPRQGATALNILFRDGERIPSAPPQPQAQSPPAAAATMLAEPTVAAPPPLVPVAPSPPQPAVAPDGAGGKPSAAQCAFTPEVSPALGELVEREVLSLLMPSLVGLQRRRQQLHCLAEYLAEAIQAIGQSEGRPYGDLRVFIFGSVNMRTVLPDGDNDITLEIDGLLPPAEPVSGADESTGRSPTSVSKAFTVPLTTDSNYGNKEGTLQLVTTVEGKPFLAPPTAINIAAGELLAKVRDYLTSTGTHPVYVDTLIVAEVRVLKLVLDGGSYDVTVNQFGGVNCVSFIHTADAAIGCQHLLKRTMLLLKSWCCYEARVLGGQAGYIGSYAATVMLISMLNTVEFLEDLSAPADGEGDTDKAGGGAGGPFDRLTPMVLVARFLKFYSYFDFTKYCVTAFGPLRLSEITNVPLDLSRLEVPAAHTAPPPDLPPGQNQWGVDTDCLGLTPEGEAAIGNLVRRRQRPLLTVSGAKHLLHEQNCARERERRRRYEQRQRGGPTCATPPPPEEETEAHEEGGGGSTALNRPGRAEDDVDLVCPSCNTAMFPVRVMNVLDPLRWSSNMVRGVCRNHFQRILKAFEEGLRQFEKASARLQMAPLSPVPSVGSSARSAAAPDGGDDGGPSLGARESEVLQCLFGGTLTAVQRNQAINCPWREEGEEAPGMPQCPGCPRPSVLCTPVVSRMCEAVCVLDGPQHRPTEAELHQRRIQGPLGEAQVPVEHSQQAGGGGGYGRQQQQQHAGGYSPHTGTSGTGVTHAYGQAPGSGGGVRGAGGGAVSVVVGQNPNIWSSSDASNSPS